MRLNGKVAIVTGAGGGFGEGIAKRYAAEGAKVAVLDLRGDAAERVAAEIGESAIAIAADVGSAADVAAAVARTTEAFGTPHILVNNAGTTHRNQPLMEVDEEAFDRVFRVNVKSIFHFVRALAPAMRDNGGGVILNVGSTAGIRPRPGLTWYNASKGAVNLMSKSLAVELAPWKIRVNALCPVMGETGLLEAFMGVPDTRRTGRSSSRRSRWGGCRGRPTSPTWRCSWPPTRRSSSRAWRCRSTGGGRCDVTEPAPSVRGARSSRCGDLGSPLRRGTVVRCRPRLSHSGVLMRSRSPVVRPDGIVALGVVRRHLRRRT